MLLLLVFCSNCQQSDTWSGFRGICHGERVLHRVWHGSAVAEEFQSWYALRVGFAREVGVSITRPSRRHCPRGWLHVFPLVKQMLSAAAVAQASCQQCGKPARDGKPLAACLVWIYRVSTTSQQYCCSVIVSAAAVSAGSCWYGDRTARHAYRSRSCIGYSQLLNVQATEKTSPLMARITGNAAQVSHSGAARARSWLKKRPRVVG